MIVLGEGVRLAYGNAAWYALANAAGGAARNAATLLPAGVMESMAELLESGGTRDVESVEIAGRTYTLLARTTGRPRQVFVFFRETSEARLLRECLLQSDRLSQLGQIVSGVGHEINNPAAFIHANVSALGRYVRTLASYLVDLEGLAEDLAPADPDRAAGLRAARARLKIGDILDDAPPLLADCLHGIERIRRVIADLRSFARPCADLEERVDLHELLDAAIALAPHDFGQRIRIQRSYGGRAVLVGVAKRLTQVFVNLLSNAAQAIAERGTIRLRTTMSGDEVEVAITDDGSGIPASVEAHLFEPFVTTKGPTATAGLGLYVCHNVVRQHGGEIQIESEVGRGTTVRVRLPIPNAGDES